MDYSLLLGLHFKVPRLPSALSLGHVSMVDLPLHDAVVSKFLANNEALMEQEVNCKCVVSASSELQHDSKLARGNTSASAGEAVTDTWLPASERYSIRLGLNMPAKACRRLQRGKGDSHLREVYDVVLYFGIIDILQKYDMGKKLEHAYKSIQFDSLSISAVDPELYSKRFQQFMHQIFPVNP